MTNKAKLSLLENREAVKKFINVFEVPVYSFKKDSLVGALRHALRGVDKMRILRKEIEERERALKEDVLLFKGAIDKNFNVSFISDRKGVIKKRLAEEPAIEIIKDMVSRKNNLLSLHEVFGGYEKREANFAKVYEDILSEYKMLLSEKMDLYEEHGVGKDTENEYLNALLGDKFKRMSELRRYLVKEGVGLYLFPEKVLIDGNNFCYARKDGDFGDSQFIGPIYIVKLIKQLKEKGVSSIVFFDTSIHSLVRKNFGVSSVSDIRAFLKEMSGADNVIFSKNEKNADDMIFEWVEKNALENFNKDTGKEKAIVLSYDRFCDYVEFKGWRRQYVLPAGVMMEEGGCHITSKGLKNMGILSNSA